MFLPPLLLIGVCTTLTFAQTERRFWFPWFLIPLFFFVAAFGRRRRPGLFPVRSLIGATKKLSEGDYTVRVSGAEGGPMREVVVAFNEMARRLETSSTQRKELLADLGHELRTPLTVLQGEIEAMIDGVHKPDPEQMERLLEETKVISRLLDDLRTLSLSEAGELRLEREEVDLGGVLEDAADSFRRRAETAGIELVVEATTLVSQVDPVRIREIVSNLLSNALRHAPARKRRPPRRNNRKPRPTESASRMRGRGFPKRSFPEFSIGLSRARTRLGPGWGYR